MFPGTYDCDRFDGCNGRNLSDPFHCRGLLFLLYARLFRIYGNEKIRWDSVCWNGYRCSSCVPVYCGHYGRWATVYPFCRNDFWVTGICYIFGDSSDSDELCKLCDSGCISLLFCGKAGTIFGSLYSTVGEGICRTNAYNFGRCCSGTSGIGTDCNIRK